MSAITEKSPKHCGEKQTYKIKRFNKRFSFYLSMIFLSILCLIFLVWLILHPTKPEFSLRDAQINQLNLTSSSFLNSSIQLTILSNNPNKKVGIYYDEFLVHASYKSQRITPETPIPPFYQDHDESNILSTSLVGYQQPVSPSFSYEVQRDQGIGRLVLNFKVLGRLRWKVGTYVSGRYRFVVNCITIMQIGNTPALPLSLRQGTECSTEL